MRADIPACLSLFAAPIVEADARLAPRLDGDRLAAIASALPGAWVAGDAYAAHLTARLDEREGFVEQAEAARGDERAGRALRTGADRARG